MGGLCAVSMSLAFWRWSEDKDERARGSPVPTKTQSEPRRAATFLVARQRMPSPNSTAVEALQQAALEPVDRRVAEVEQEPALPTERTEAERLAEEQLVLQRTYSELEARFENQEGDRVWGAATEANLSAAFRRAEAHVERVQVESVECGSELCKSVLLVDDERHGQGFVHTFSRNMPPGLEYHFSYEGTRVTIHGIRRDDALGSDE